MLDTKCSTLGIRTHN